MAGSAAPRHRDRNGSASQEGSRILRWMGLLSVLVTLAGVGLNFAWFARRGLGPGALVAMSWPLWLVAGAAVVAVAGGGWVLGRLLAGRNGGSDESRP